MRRRYLRRKRHIPSILMIMALFSALLLINFQGSEANESKEKEKVASIENFTETTTSVSREITLLRTKTGVSETMDLEEYIYGVVAAEVPYTFETEAIKAQSIVARTYALSRLENGGTLSDDFASCQAYSDDTMLKERWGDGYETNAKRFHKAVESTKGLVVTYEGALAKTYFHSTCGGKTSSAQEVWGGDVPYLQSVVCTWDTDAPRYEETKTIAKKDVAAALEGASEVALPVSQGFTQSGRVATVSYDGKAFSATDFRKLLALNSTNFTMKDDGNAITVTTKGFGHGVGLCQYGANGMAKEGWDAKKIIGYYYTGVKIESYR